MAEMNGTQFKPVKTRLPRVREYMQDYIANTYTVKFEGEVVGPVRRGPFGKRWATLMDGESAVDIGVPARYWPSGIRDGSLISVTAKPRCEAPRGRIEWVVDDSAVRMAGPEPAVEHLGRGAMAIEREKVARELGLPDVPQESLAGVADSTGIRRIRVLQGTASQVAPDFKGALEKRGPLPGVTCIPKSVGVQGEESVARLIQQLDQVSASDADLVVIIRGGGSPADFQDFNKRDLVAAVHNCRVPVVTALGHSEHVPLAARAAAANFATPATAGAEIRSEVWKRRNAANGRPSYAQLKEDLRQTRRQLIEADGQRKVLRDRNARMSRSLADEHQKTSELEERERRASSVASTESLRALNVSLDCAVQRIRFTALVRGLWGVFWAAVVGTVLGFEQGVSWFVALLSAGVLAAWAAYILTGGVRAQRIREAHASQLHHGREGLERRYAELALVRTPRALRQWYARAWPEPGAPKGGQPRSRMRVSGPLSLVRGSARANK